MPDPGLFKVDAIQMFKHEAYDAGKIYNDIALLKLPNPVTLTGRITTLNFEPVATLKIFSQHQAHRSSYDVRRQHHLCWKNRHHQWIRSHG